MGFFWAPDKHDSGEYETRSPWKPGQPRKLAGLLLPFVSEASVLMFLLVLVVVFSWLAAKLLVRWL